MEILTHLKNKYSLDLEQEIIKVPFDRFRGLTGLFKEAGFKVGAEIGVYKGKYSKWLCVKNSGSKLFLIDPYKAYPEYVEQHDEAGQKVMDQCYKEAQERLTRFNVEFIKKTSMEALNDFVDESLDFVFIDGNHTFEYVVADIAGWSKKVKKGGIVSGHDYYRSIESKKMRERYGEGALKLIQTKDAVDGWVKANRIKPLFLTTESSWFYVKI